MTFRIIKGNQEVSGTLPPSEAVGAVIVVGGLGLQDDDKAKRSPKARKNPDDPLHYANVYHRPIDNSVAKSVIKYLSNLKISQGRLAGKKFKVLPWQKRFVYGAFHEGISKAALSVARGNGKTALLSGIAAATLDGPLHVSRGETVICASSFEQARIAFEHVLAFLGDKLRNQAQWKVWDTAQQARIENRITGARVRCIGSDPKRAHGLAPVLVLADEPSQWPTSTGEKMRAALITAQGKQKNSRFVALGTRPSHEDHWFAKMLLTTSEKAYAQVHAAKETASKFSKVSWLKANPSMPHMPDLEISIRDEAIDAKKDSSLLASFDALRLNLGTADIETAFLLDADTWTKLEALPEGAISGPMVWGVDLGATAAQSAIAAYWPESGRLECVACFPRLPSLAERGLRDGVGGLYSDCHKRGELLTLGDHTSDVGLLLKHCLERWGQPSRIVADRWRDGDLKEALTKGGVPFTDLELRGQGFKDGGEDVRLFRKACLGGRVSPPKSLLLRSAMGEARTVSDPAGNSKLAKGSEGGRRLRARDDAVAATILAVSAGIRVYPNTAENTSLPDEFAGAFI